MVVFPALMPIEFQNQGSFVQCHHGVKRPWLSERLVEFDLSDTSFISIAAASRATVDAARGAGITLSWQVADLEEWRLYRTKKVMMVMSRNSHEAAAMLTPA